MKKKIALALVACTILSSGGGAYAYTTTPVAYVSMDINPSVELGVNVFDKVVSVQAYNDDGKKIIEGTDLTKYQIDNAISKLISNAISEGYIKEDGSSAIEITTSTDKQKVASKLDDTLKEAADKTLNKNHVEADVETENVAIARRDESIKLGITPGKLNLIQKLQELDKTITVEDYKDSSVKDIQKKTIELRKDNKIEEATNDSKKKYDIATNGNNNTADNSNNGNYKKEENSNDNNKNNDAAIIIEKQNNINNANSKVNNNSLNTENNSTSKLKNNSSSNNSSK